MRARRLTALLAVAIVTTLGAPLAADASPAGPAAGSGDGARTTETARRPYRPTGRLQVRFRDGVDARGRDAALARVAAKGRSAKVLTRVHGLNAALLKVDNPRAVQRLLRDDPAVLYVEAESTYRALAADPQTTERTAAALPDATSRNADTAPTGAGMEIAVIDSPVDTANPDLLGKVTVTADLTSDMPDDPDTVDLPCDAERCPHGTGVAAVAAADDDDGGVVGAAPGASVSSYNVFRRFLYTDPETSEQFEDLGASSIDIAEALDAVRTRALTNPQLVAVNLSLGGTFDNQLVRDAIAALRAAAPQVTIVVAAGNDGGERAQFPAGDPGVISVGASGVVGNPETCSFTGGSTVASFSNRGDVDLIAPGTCIRTWYRPENEDIPGQHEGAAVIAKVNGTSFAAPMVTGVVALLGAAGVTGDAARAAILAGANHPGTVNFASGVGNLNAAGALAIATGTSAYTAAFIDRGGQVANVVGRRDVEVLQVQPGGPAPAQVAPVLDAGRGTLTSPSSGTSGTVRRTTYKYTVPSANIGGVIFKLTAGTLKVPLRLLDPTDSFEGLPVASGDQTSVGLGYGSRSAYVRSAYLGAGASWNWSYGYGDGEFAGDPDVGPSSDLYMWEPSTSGGTADAAFEPMFAQQGDFYTGTQTDVTPRAGRFLIGWVLFSAEDNSDATSRYQLKVNYPGGPSVSATAPALASVNSSSGTATGPFRVSWTGTDAVKYEVEYATKVLSGSSWVFGPWKVWTTTTGPAGYMFGQGSSPVAVVKGQTYHFRVRTFDADGNPSLYSNKAVVAPQDNLSTSFSYAGSWAKRALGGRWAGWVHQSAGAGSSVSHRAATSQFTVVGDRCATCGQFRVYVDNVLKATVDTRASSPSYRQTLWTSASMGNPAYHTIKIVVVGTAGRPWVVIDGIGTLR